MLKIIKTVFNTFVDWGNILNKPSTFTPSSHTQDISTIDNLQDSLDNKIDTSEYNSKINQDVRITASPVFQAINSDQINSTGLLILGNDINKTTCSVQAPAGTNSNVQEWKQGSITYAIINKAGNLGLGSTTPQAPLHLQYGTSGGLPAITAGTNFLLQSNSATASPSIMTLLSGSTGLSKIQFGNTSDDNVGSVQYNNSTNELDLRVNKVFMLQLNQPSNTATINATTVNTNATLMQNTADNATFRMQMNTNQNTYIEMLETSTYGFQMWNDGANNRFIFNCINNSVKTEAFRIDRANAVTTIQKGVYYSSDGSAGATGSFASPDGKTITVKNGLITSIV